MAQRTGTCPKCRTRQSVYAVGKSWLVSWHETFVGGGFARPMVKAKCPGTDRYAEAVSN